jgi:hypothetical protein
MHTQKSQIKKKKEQQRNRKKNITFSIIQVADAVNTCR